MSHAAKQGERSARGLVALAGLFLSCSSGAGDAAGGGQGGSAGGDAKGAGGESTAGSTADGGAALGGRSEGGGEALDPPHLASTNEICKLISDVNLLDPTANETQTRANVLGTDLGIPVGHGEDLYFFFGDTVGFKGIWPFSESVPDAVGFAVDGRSGVAADPASLCDGLRFLRLSPEVSVGPSIDPAIEADFAGAAMSPPAGHAISEFIENPAGPPGQNAFPALPGSFEVPSGAFSYRGSIYVFYTTVEGPNALVMKGSYLARWSAPSTSGTPAYQILHAVDERLDAEGALGGNFINIAAEPSGEYVYLFGTGEYRQSPIHLARKALASLEEPSGYEVFDAGAGQWLAAPASSAAPIIEEPTFGETSFRFFPEIGRWMFMAQGGHRIVARFASRPEGPWSDEITLHDNTEQAFLDQYCCVPDDGCSGERLFNCDKAGFYGTYVLPDVAVDATGFRVTYTMSTWDPYNVALFSARFDQP